MHVIAGLMLLFQFLANLFMRFIALFFEQTGRRLLVIAAVLAVLAGLVVAFYAAIKGLIENINLIAPAELSQAASLVVPDNFVTIASIQITARLLRFAYEWNVKVLQWRL